MEFTRIDPLPAVEIYLKSQAATVRYKNSKEMLVTPRVGETPQALQMKVMGMNASSSLIINADEKGLNIRIKTIPDPKEGLKEKFHAYSQPQAPQNLKPKETANNKHDVITWDPADAVQKDFKDKGLVEARELLNILDCLAAQMYFIMLELNFNKDSDSFDANRLRLNAFVLSLLKFPATFRMMDAYYTLYIGSLLDPVWRPKVCIVFRDQFIGIIHNVMNNLKDRYPDIYKGQEKQLASSAKEDVKKPYWLQGMDQYVKLAKRGTLSKSLLREEVLPVFKESVRTAGGEWGILKNDLQRVFKSEECYKGEFSPNFYKNYCQYRERFPIVNSLLTAFTLHNKHQTMLVVDLGIEICEEMLNVAKG